MPYKRKAIEQASLARLCKAHQCGMHIFVEMNGNSVRLDVAAENTIADVKELLSNKLLRQYAPNQMGLYWGQHGCLQEGMTLSNYNIKKCSILDAIAM